METEEGETVDRLKDGSLTLDAVSVRYRDNLPLALDKVSFTLDSGCKLGVCGRTGSGKSTLLRTMLRLVDYEGSLWVGGREAKTLTLRSLRQAIACVTQSAVMLKGDLRRTVDPRNRLSEAELSKLLQTVGLHVPLSQPTLLLSQGERQLASFARALACVLYGQASVLLLDEASSSIDPVSEKKVSAALESLRDTTVVIIAHRLSTILSCDVVAVMDHASLVEMGPPALLSAERDGHFAALLRGTHTLDNVK